MLHAAMEALSLLLEPMHLVYLVAGVLLGLTLGAIPGLGGVVGLAVMIPFTYSLDAHAAFALLLGLAAVTTSSDLIPCRARSARRRRPSMVTPWRKRARRGGPSARASPPR